MVLRMSLCGGILGGSINVKGYVVCAYLFISVNTISNIIVGYKGNYLREKFRKQYIFKVFQKLIFNVRLRSLNYSVTAFAL